MRHSAEASLTTPRPLDRHTPTPRNARKKQVFPSLPRPDADVASYCDREAESGTGDCNAARIKKGLIRDFRGRTPTPRRIA
ncbi:MAG: hypothetical protein WD009_06325, partial [Phycisphaeraceae bacterium]